MGKKLPLKDVAELLELSTSALRRRIALLKIYPTTDDAGRVIVDADEVRSLWEKRQAARPEPRAKNSALSILMDEDERQEIDDIAEQHKLSVGETSRRLLRRGLVSYYSGGRGL